MGGALKVGMGARVMVTGGTGFIGRHVLRHGAELGYEMYCVATRAGDIPGVQYARADLRDRDRILRLVREIRPAAIMHLAAAGVSHMAAGLTDLLAINAVGTDNLLAAVESAADQCPVVIAGSGYEYAPQDRPLSEEDLVAPITAYGVAKAAVALCAGWYARRIPITLLRLFNVYGPGEAPARLIPSIVDCAISGRPAELTGCEQIRDFVYVRDAAGLFWHALANPVRDSQLRILNVGSGAPVVLREVVQLAGSILNERGFEVCFAFGARPYSANEPWVYAADVTRLREELGWAPGVELSAGLRATVESLLQAA